MRFCVLVKGVPVIPLAQLTLTDGHPSLINFHHSHISFLLADSEQSKNGLTHSTDEDKPKIQETKEINYNELHKVLLNVIASHSPGAVRYTCNRYSIYVIKKITGSPSVSLKMGGNRGLFQVRAPYGIFRAPVHMQVYNLKFL